MFFYNPFKWITERKMGEGESRNDDGFNIETWGYFDTDYDVQTILPIKGGATTALKFKYSPWNPDYTGGPRSQLISVGSRKGVRVLNPSYYSLPSSSQFVPPPTSTQNEGTLFLVASNWTAENYTWMCRVGVFLLLIASMPDGTLALVNQPDSNWIPVFAGISLAVGTTSTTVIAVRMRRNKLNQTCFGAIHSGVSNATVTETLMNENSYELLDLGDLCGPGFGILHEFRYWKYALTDKEMTDVYSSLKSKWRTV